jgi:hypothetical protein
LLAVVVLNLPLTFAPLATEALSPNPAA